jgi:putative ABC transport system permease protein
VRILFLKTWRDMKAHKGQFGSLIALVALGILSFVAFLTGYLDLSASVERANAELKLADFSVAMLGAPAGELSAVRRVPGVLAAEGRLIVDAGLDVGGDKQPVARVIGVPEDRHSRVNDLLVEKGRYLSDAHDEILLHSKYANDTGAKVGDTLLMRLGEERKRLRVVGIAASPEYMYAVRSKGDLPTPGDFAVLFMRQSAVERLFGRPNEITDVAVLVSPGADTDRVIDDVEKVLEPYRIVSTVKQADQPSNYLIHSEIEQNRVMSIWMPLLILGISASTLFIALSRLVNSQRGQIGLAKALGYTDGQVLLHYLLFSVTIALAGSVLGMLLGDLLAREIAREYVTMLGVPYMDHHVYWQVMLGAAAISTLACLAAGYAPARRSARMAPANAMRSDPNAAVAGGRVPLVERAFGWAMPRTFTLRIPVRNVFRARRRSAYTVLGIAFAMILTVATQAMFDTMGVLIERVFTTSERWEVLAAYETQFGGERITHVRKWDGVSKAQGALIVPIELKDTSATHEGVLTAMDPSADFHGFTVISGTPAVDTLSRGEMVLAQGLANKLGVRVGDTLSAKTPYRDERIALRVGAISDEPLGVPAFVSMAKARELLGKSSTTYNALYVNVDPRHVQQVKDDLFDLPGASSVTVKSTMLGSLLEMMEFANFYQAILFAFGFAMAFVVIYTTFTSNILERTREIATMRTIGEDNGRLAAMVTVENLILALAGIPLGVWLGIQAAEAMFASFSSESYTLKAAVSPMSILWLSLATLAVLLLSEGPAIRRIFRMDLAESTKVME